MNSLIFLLCLGFQLDPAVKQSVTEAFARLNRFQVSFNQETYSAFFDETYAAGTFSIARPGKMRMDYTEGEQIQRIWDGKTAFERDAMADSESRLEQAELSDEPIVRVLLYGDDLAGLFLIDRKNDGKTDIFRLRPRDDDTYHVEVIFDKNWLPAQIEIIGSDGEGTRFEFHDFVLNPKFADDTFIVPAEKP
ncbi:MAG: outer membrane lipoprotein carrier protein LolA [Acidobacteriota bacterium]|nr:outer membrane lipoprotein carrier protein LolA [Acidobacteriota bacterium]